MIRCTSHSAPSSSSMRARGRSAAAFVAAALLVLAVAKGRHAGAISAGSLARSAGVALLVTLAATFGATLTWLLVTSLRSTPSVFEGYLYLLCLLGCGAALGMWLSGRMSDKRLARPFGFVLAWVLLGLLTAFAAPGFSYLFTLPALAAAIALNWDPGSSNTLAGIRFALVAAPTVILLTPAVDFFFQLGQPRPGNPDSSIPATVAVALLLAFLAGGLLVDVWRNPHSAGESEGDVAVFPVPSAAGSAATQSDRGSRSCFLSVGMSSLVGSLVSAGTATWTLHTSIRRPPPFSV